MYWQAANERVLIKSADDRGGGDGNSKMAIRGPALYIAPICRNVNIKRLYSRWGNSSLVQARGQTAESSAKERVVQRVFGCDPPTWVHNEALIQQVHETGYHLHFLIL